MDMPSSILVVCVFVSVGLTFWAIIAMGRARVAALKSRDVGISEIALNTDAYPEAIQKLQNNTRNQFETPPIFYAAVAIALALDMTSWPMAVLAMIYVTLRIVHRIIHVGSNHLIHRFRVFLISIVALAGVWLSLGISLFLS